MSDPVKLRACASALRTMMELRPSMRTGHLAQFCDEEADRLERIRRDLEWWPARQEERA